MKTTFGIPEPFVLRDASFRGSAEMTPELRNMTPAQLREVAYDLP